MRKYTVLCTKGMSLFNTKSLNHATLLVRFLEWVSISQIPSKI